MTPLKLGVVVKLTCGEGAGVETLRQDCGPAALHCGRALRLAAIRPQDDVACHLGMRDPINHPTPPPKIFVSHPLNHTLAAAISYE
jgi:hypothetical protein